MSVHTTTGKRGALPDYMGERTLSYVKDSDEIERADCARARHVITIEVYSSGEGNVREAGSLARRTNSVTLATVAGLLAGCSAFTGYPQNYQSTSAVITADSPYLSADVLKNERSTSDTDRGNLNPQQYRDAVVYARLQVVDINYYDFESTLSGTFNAIDLGADLTALALNGLGATTGSAATKAALAAASAGVIGARAAISTDIFYQKTLPALIAQMRADRQTTLATIIKGLSQPVSSYSLDAALLDVNDYYVMGTLPSAIAQVTAKAGAQLQQANNAIAVTRDAAFMSSYSTRQRVEAKIAKLTSAQALSVYNAVKQYIPQRSAFVQSLLKAIDPNNTAATNGASALTVLKAWVANDPLDNGLDAQMTSAITKATGS
jgi:hypothetical protein